MAATDVAMPMPTDPVTNERLENVLLGIAQQIEGAMSTVKSELIGLITEAELRWQSKLEAQLEAQGPAPPGAASELGELRAELAQSQGRVDDKLRAQNAELQQLQQGLTDLEAHTRSTTTTTNQRLEERTEVVLDTMTEHFDVVFEGVKTAVETLDWRVTGQANEIWWLNQNHPGSVSELVADLESRLQRQTHSA